MEKLSILTADLLDIIFEYRNKLYGAYDLRKTYPKRMAWAMAGTALICLLFAGGTILANAKRAKVNIDMGPDVVLVTIDPPEAPPPPLPPPPPQEAPPPVAMSQYTPPLIVPDIDAPDEPIADIDKLDDTRIGNINQDGRHDDGVVAPPVEKNPNIAVKPTEEATPFTPVQIAAEFPGGAEGWTKYLRKNLNSDLPSQNGAPLGKYTVIVSFIVAVDGAISDVQAENDPGFGTKAEAVRVIVKGPHWRPAVQNGRNVVYRHKQSITFQVMEE
jgi:protein TonB